ncbi:ribosomal protein S18-alanine N-acetyltransferase [Neptuniibacter sp.]|uniref:ribosomal protein S18-alanine N-acetyltransferase n=1 Tax=Neptuniibacter sp. TaxID=1962643 RepID=UPI002601AF0F|nr:ribosomal protein S18-alanine N-acetyltransferase [Neptuniibacter sp.]MCP4595636.1 ribosomal protein S18-alanine N-acetyltransferase [Neptuniibacter sp.]
MSSFHLLAENDLTRLLEIESRCFSSPLSESQFRQILLNSRGFNFGVLVDELAGFALFSTVLDEAELLQVAVDPDYQRRGLSYALLQEALAQLSAAGISKVMLEVRESNAAAIALYVKLGFTEDGRRKDYYPALIKGAEREDAVLLSCELQGEKTS